MLGQGRMRREDHAGLRREERGGAYWIESAQRDRGESIVEKVRKKRLKSEAWGTNDFITSNSHRDAFVIYQVAAPHQYSNQVPVGQDTQLGLPGGNCGKSNSIRLTRKNTNPIN